MMFAKENKKQMYPYQVAEVITSLGTGGAEKLVVQIAQGINKNKYKATIITLCSVGGVPCEMARAAGIPIIEINANGFYDPFALPKLQKILKKFDIVHSHNTAAQVFCALVCNKNKLLTTEHTTCNRRRRFHVLRLLDFWLYSRYTKIICISDAVKKYLEKWIPSTCKKTVVIQNGIDLASFLIPKSRKHEANIRTAICVARFETEKNHINLLKAFVNVDNDIHLVLVGDGSLNSELNRISKELGIESRVKFVGVQRDVSSWLAQADFFVLVSKWEGFGLAAVEAMAIGLPLVVSRVPGLGELVKDGENGFLVDPDDPNDIARACNLICKDDQVLYEMGAESFSLSRRYSIDNMLTAYCEVFDSLIVSNHKKI